MTSAVPYEPDDFDNNPFAESSVIIQPEQHQNPYQQATTTQAEPTESALPALPAPAIKTQTQERQPISNNGQPQQQNIPSPQRSKPQQNAKGQAQPRQTKEDQELNAPLNSFPTDLDFKRYLPERLNKNSFSLSIKVAEIEKNGNAQFKNPIIKLNAQINAIPGFRKNAYKDVRRSFKELEQFYKYLIYNNIEVFVPALPNIPTLYNSGSPEFINSLIISVQDWFNRVCTNPILIRNQEFVLFLEQNDFTYTPSKTKPSTNSVMATGIKRKTLKQFQPPYDASNELAEYRPLIKSIYVQSQKLLEKLDKLLRLQKHSSNTNTEFYTKLSELAPLELDPEMGKIWVKFNKVLQLFNDFELIEEVSLNAHLSETFQLISDDCYNIKESLTNRHLLMRELINAEDGSKKQQATIAKIKAKSILDPERVEHAIYMLSFAKNYEKELKHQLKRTTYEMLVEAQEYMDYLSNLVRKTFKAVAQQQIQQERKKLHLLTSNKLIHPQESLSRLGRESLPLNSHNISKQDGGDSWNSRPKKDFETTAQDNFDGLLNGDLPDEDTFDDEISKVDAKSAASLLAGASF